MLSRQKLAITGFVVAAALVVLGRWGLTTPSPRVRDLAAIFGGGFVAALSTVRFLKIWRAPPTSPAGSAAVAPPPKSKS